MAITAFEQLFIQRSLPADIRSDNGVPFASVNWLFNLSKLSVVAALAINVAGGSAWG